MPPNEKLTGVYVAAVTPLTPGLTPALEYIPELMQFYAERGAHGALLLGTTGEGPSFSIDERRAIYQAAAGIKSQHPEFSLLAGTGTPSLEDTIALNRYVFELGYDGAVVLPPYYFRTASEDGLYAWFSRVIEASVPDGGKLLGYHFPQVSGVGLSTSLLTRLASDYPEQFGGIKDSSGDLAHGQETARDFPYHSVLVGNDRLMSAALEAGAAGCITALANLISPLLREIYEQQELGNDTSAFQQIVDEARSVLDDLAPFPAGIKGLLAEMHGFPLWPVKPPLLSLSEIRIKAAAEKLRRILE